MLLSLDDGFLATLAPGRNRNTDDIGMCLNSAGLILPCWRGFFEPGEASGFYECVGGAGYIARPRDRHALQVRLREKARMCFAP